MPVYNRQTLRQRLSTEILRDTIVGATSGSIGTPAGTFHIVDSSQADPTACGEQLYHRHWLRLLGTTGRLQDLRVGSFNTGSGAFLGAVTLATTIFSGMPYEVHGLLDPSEKDIALDAVIKDLRTKDEQTLWSVDSLRIYSLGEEVLDVIDVRYYSDPAGSLSRGEGRFTWFALAHTASGQELRISSALPASYQIVYDAILTVSLGAEDLATVNLLSNELVMWGAAARCFWMLEQQSPGQEAGKYRERRREAARMYTKLSKRFEPKIARKIQLDEYY